MNDIHNINNLYREVIKEQSEEPRYNNGMIKLLRDVVIRVDNGYHCDCGCGWNSWWERESRQAGEELDPDDRRIDISDLEEGEDFVFT